MSQPEKSAEKLPLPRLDFKKAAQQILRDHPEATGRLLIIDPATHERYGSLGARLRARTTGAFRKQLKEAFKKASETKGVVADVIRLGPVSAVILTAGRENPEEALFDLHRQAGRLLVTRAVDNIRYFQALFGTPYAAPVAAADAYAAIRYLRQPDADPEFLRCLSLTRTTDFLRTGDPENLSSFVIDKIVADRDFSKLKIADLAETAGIYVKGYTPSRAESDALVREFAPMKGKALDEAGLKLLAELVKASKNPLAVKLAAHALPEISPESSTRQKPGSTGIKA
jgi:hypothetical protein